MDEDDRKRSKWDETHKQERVDRSERGHRERANYGEKESRHRDDRDRVKGREERDRDRDRDRDRHRDRGRGDRDRSRDRERDRLRDKDRERERGQDAEKDKERERRGMSRWDDSQQSRSPRTSMVSSKPSRSRSPAQLPASPRVPEAKPTFSDPAAAAAAAAARINAQINAKRGVSSLESPPVKSIGKPSTPVANASLNTDVYIADGDYIKDIEVNDLRNRYTLTKGSTQKMIKEETGADVTTRGAYYPDKAMATPQNPPLYLHVTSTTKEGLDKAVEKIEELMKQELGSLVDERRFRRREPVEQLERDEFGRRKWPEERIPIGLEPIPGFNLRASVVGHQGAYVKHIQQETRCRVQIKGKGSGFMENNINRESDEEMYLHVTGPDPHEVENARKLCEDLVANVTTQYEAHKAQPTTRYQGYNHHHHNQHHSGHNSHNYNNHHSPSPHQQHNGDIQSTVTAAVAASGAAGSSTTDYTQGQTYNPYTAYGQADPYAAYGGYQAYAAYYAQYMAQQQQQQAPGAPGAPLPSGMSNDSTASAYNAVKPPPGL